ncbi:unnamed protein product [Enterobius vermicularis]|uniref:Ubiquitin-like modifier-activating enzyme ATG7 n=1 Tax=Enterobius vermicularis TaxID=51028 RepID=A0A0N4UYA3_ENTVE|nr:unnamed protein product [Enterobius vermicularis]
MNVQFLPINTFVDTSFWSEVNRRKLNLWKLSEGPFPVRAVYDNSGNHSASLLSFSFDAFTEISRENLPRGVVPVHGDLFVYNSLVSYEKADREAFLKKYASEASYTHQTPDLLTTFILTVFADLKKFKYDYWNCIPALIYPKNMKMLKEPEVLTKDICALIFNNMGKYRGEPFLLTSKGSAPLSDILLNKTVSQNEVDLVFMDPSTEQLIPGWPLRNLIAAVAYSRKDWSSMRIICFRGGRSYSAFRLVISWDSQQNTLSDVAVGWERDLTGKPAKLSVDLRSRFDPIRLMEHSVELNLRLIRWRLVPGLQLELYSNLKCLILGSGTLGCNIARSLLGWGVRNFSFVDNCTVSFSNPVRQSLFEYADALDGGKSKSKAAADALRRIFPSVKAEAYDLTIPMPGHTVSAEGKEEVTEAINLLEKLIIDHDVVFLVMDSREARWLPCLLSTYHQKLAISVALGFDSYVVVRHGFSRPDKLSCDVPLDSVVIPGSHLGCYFCCDVTAPGNTVSDRTLDQQCTVSRPGVSMQAAGAAVELLAAVLQHPRTGMAPARVDENDESTTILGATPHQIRCFVSKFQQITPTVIRFLHCLACGKAVNAAFENGHLNFLMRVFNEPKYLETISGLEQMEKSFNELSIWDFNDNDSVASSSSL